MLNCGWMPFLGRPYLQRVLVLVYYLPNLVPGVSECVTKDTLVPFRDFDGMLERKE